MAYTKYSLTPANNTAAPPDGAPEGMLPSAVNDTMRDMMAQIRDVGDGIRDGTYTMTAPKITGGTITGVAFTGNTFTSPVISGGSINNTPIGATTANTGAFTTLSATGVTTVQAGTVSLPAITTTGDTNTGIFFPAADTIAFTEGGVESMRIDSSGNLCVGSTAAGNAGALNVSVGLAGTTVGGLQLWSTTNSTHYVNFGDGTTGTDTYRGYVGYAHGSDALLFGTSTVERMRIDSSGNVGIGTSSPSEKLSVTGNVTATGTNTSATYFHRSIAPATESNIETSLATTGNAANQRAGLFAFNDYNNTVATDLIFKTNPTTGSASERMRITSGGEVYIAGTADQGAYNLQCNGTGVWGAGAYVNGSDARIKEDIEPIQSGLDVVEKLNPVTYRYKEEWSKDQSTQTGFIAQELLTALDGQVYVDGVVQQGGEYMSVAYQNIIPILTKSIQELHEIVKAQAAEIALLKLK